ncbi:hypothetical protein RFI_00778 [Reticulomyxa filosa]|uniref:Uncharacterized protein n=1 Tax=Reticulomyxa filosa TaxID=46433 RepID=X6PDZ4_RETFI|nr:hypothetical protein RFI_00778 [Reticulomyxa filosa]|eukprot:ETO36284.1 hypothetical protein RFI_00778 [Reticulomyxa filosa]
MFDYENFFVDVEEQGKEFFYHWKKNPIVDQKKMDTKTRQLEKLKTTIENLRNDFDLLLESTHVGKTQLKYVGTNTMRSEFEQKAVPLAIRKQKFQDIYDQTERQKLIANVSANQIVQSVHNLLDLTNELKIAYIIHNS